MHHQGNGNSNHPPRGFIKDCLSSPAGLPESSDSTPVLGHKSSCALHGASKPAINLINGHQGAIKVSRAVQTVQVPLSSPLETPPPPPPTGFDVIDEECLQSPNQSECETYPSSSSWRDLNSRSGHLHQHHHLQHGKSEDSEQVKIRLR